MATYHNTEEMRRAAYSFAQRNGIDTAALHGSEIFATIESRCHVTRDMTPNEQQEARRLAHLWDIETKRHGQKRI